MLRAPCRARRFYNNFRKEKERPSDGDTDPFWRTTRPRQFLNRPERLALARELSGGVQEFQQKTSEELMELSDKLESRDQDRVRLQKRLTRRCGAIARSSH